MTAFLQQLVNGLSLGSIYALIALGYTMVYGIIKLINFAHGDIYMLGAYCAFLITTYCGLGFIPALLISMFFCGVVGVLIERIAYKPLRHATRITALITAIGVSYVLEYATQYIYIMTIGFIPFALSQCISSSMRECGETRLPMIASVSAVVVNFIGNSILIFGLFGFPALGPAGAAIATVISRFAEMLLSIFFALKNKERFPFYTGLFHHFSIPANLVKSICIKGFHLSVMKLCGPLAQL